MTLLLLDIGNSRLKWAAAEFGVLQAAGAFDHGGDPVAAAAEISVPSAKAIWISNVTGPALGERLGAALQARFGVAPKFATVSPDYRGLRIAYDHPQRLGVDRWVALYAAWKQSGGAACVVSAGTALTFDAVDEEGQHRGGVIAPGLLTMQQAVLGATRFDSTGPAADYTDGLGKNTEACVRQGALHAAAGLIERLGSRYRGGGRCFLTGGDADTLLPHLPVGWTLAPNLVQQGLLSMALEEDSD